VKDYALSTPEEIEGARRVCLSGQARLDQTWKHFEMCFDSLSPEELRHWEQWLASQITGDVQDAQRLRAQLAFLAFEEILQRRTKRQLQDVGVDVT